MTGRRAAGRTGVYGGRLYSSTSAVIPGLSTGKKSVGVPILVRAGASSLTRALPLVAALRPEAVVVAAAARP